jgi:hypothetical protein
MLSLSTMHKPYRYMSIVQVFNQDVSINDTIQEFIQLK